MGMRKRTQAREAALQILYQYEMNPGPVRELMDNYWNNNEPVQDEVRLFAEKIVAGTIAQLKELDEVITRAAQNWHLERMAVIDRNILRFAAYELLYMDDVPPKVTINEAVNIAKRFSQEESGKFVNGILDHINHKEQPRTFPSHGKSQNQEE
jgi:transcription antitermination factor NusB